MGLGSPRYLMNRARASYWLASRHSHLPISEFFLQISRRGCAKKTMTSLAQSILNNHYIGKGVRKNLTSRSTSCSVTNRTSRCSSPTKARSSRSMWTTSRMPSRSASKLSATDYVIASFLAQPESQLLCVTQTGKVIHRESKNIDTSKSSTAKGQALIPPSRLEQGVRLAYMGAAAVQDGDQVVVLMPRGDQDSRGWINDRRRFDRSRRADPVHWQN